MEGDFTNHVFQSQLAGSFFLGVDFRGFAAFREEPRGGMWGDLGMDQYRQYLLIPFLMGRTSIYQLFWCSPGVQGFDTLTFHQPCDQRCEKSLWKKYPASHMRTMVLEYLHTFARTKSPSHVGKYTSTMEHMGLVNWHSELENPPILNG